MNIDRFYENLWPPWSDPAKPNQAEKNMHAKDCPAAYVHGIKHALTYPRIRGAYKLRQRHREWKESEAEVYRIARAVSHPDLNRHFKHCTPEDKVYWLRRVHLHYAFELSADIYPSFEALTGDGLTNKEAQNLMPAVGQASTQALVILESARQQIAVNIRGEYRRMKAGKSAVGDALLQVRTLLEGCITQLPPYLQAEILK